MKRPLFPGSLRASGWALALLLTLALLWPVSTPVSGFFWNKRPTGRNGGFSKTPHRQCHRL